MTNRLQGHITDVQETLDAMNPDDISVVVEMVRSSERIFTLGNGGSHSTASHMANDLLKAARKLTICVGDMTSTMLAYMNDTGVDLMFENIITQFKPTPKDLIIAFSCSGNSINVSQVLKSFRNVPSVLFTGQRGGAAKDIAKTVILVPHPSIFVQESVHSVLCHAIIEELVYEV